MSVNAVRGEGKKFTITIECEAKDWDETWNDRTKQKAVVRAAEDELRESLMVKPEAELDADAAKQKANIDANNAALKKKAKDMSFNFDEVVS